MDSLAYFGEYRGMSGGLPKQATGGDQQQQTQTAAGPSAVVEQASSGHRQQTQGCPETRQAKYDCSTVSAIANVRQADAAEWFNNAAVVEIGVGLVTAGVAFFAAKFAKDAAKAARDTLKAFIQVERADIFVTLESFEKALEGNMYVPETGTTTGGKTVVHFDVVANNLGRSAALISVVGTEWSKSKDEGDIVNFGGDPTPRTVPAGGSVTLKAITRGDNFLWVLIIITRTPLVGELRIRACYEVFDGPVEPHGTWYVVRKLDYFDGQGRKVKDGA